MPFTSTTFSFPRSSLVILCGILSLVACGPRAADWTEETRADIHRTHPLGVVGAVELVHVDQLAQTFLARIDTGATTSSIDAQGIEVFERDGEDWVRFRVQPRPLKPFEPGEEDWPEDEEKPDPIECERPLVDIIQIERSDGPNEERYVVRLSVALGEGRFAGEFTLNDRSQFQYAVLVGRNLLAGQALVDVSKKRMHGTPETETDGEQ